MFIINKEIIKETTTAFLAYKTFTPMLIYGSKTLVVTEEIKSKLLMELTY